jgi:hypothetical protein
VRPKEGRVIEIGVGSGLNLPLYRPPVKEVLALEPSPKLIAMTRQGRDPAMPVNFIEASAEAIPLDDHSIDTVVTTWTLCSIPDAAMAPDKNVRRWQDRLTPAWKRISGGCHLNRPISAMIASAGFRIGRWSSVICRAPSR